MTTTARSLRILLLQVRNADDPMRHQEIRCFARSFACNESQIEVFDLLSGVPSLKLLSLFDVVILGGSGDYSVAEGGPWLPEALAAMRELYDIGKPTFASCWGFQAMAKAMGGNVVTDINRAELGAVAIRLTDAGKQDPVFRETVFGDSGDTFLAAQGHQDIVVRLPHDATLLASSGRVDNQAFCFTNKPIYCTQFHPELDRASFLERVEAYPQYVEAIAGVSLEDFRNTFCQETPIAARILTRFIEVCL